MLHTIRQKHILIVESGCTGTFPMLLMALDAWADMRMYTTYPYLVHIYACLLYTSPSLEFAMFCASLPIKRFQDGARSPNFWQFMA